MKKENKLPSGLWFLIGVSVMFIVFRYLFFAEFGFEMDILSTFIPAFTLGVVAEHLLK